MKSIYLIMIVLLIGYLQSNSQTEISGVINKYSKVTAINAPNQTIEVMNSTDFDIGDEILLIQMKGALIDETNTDSFGTILDYRNSGNFELNKIADISDNLIILQNGICKEYDVSGVVQIVQVPRYLNVQVVGNLRAREWDGTIGGIIAIIVDGTLTLNSNIDASGSGFRGAETYNTTWTCYQMNYFYPINSWESSEKGEGIAILPAAKLFGRGAAANGGGGGNSTNAGGAGGGNYGLGGEGGKQYFDGSGCDSIDNGGASGKNLIYSNDFDKVFLGGGGGAGHENDNTATNGGSGGGIVFIKANKIEGNNRAIISAGDSALASGNDAAGGGGAGGTILMDIGEYGASILSISVNGGNGGNCNVGPYKHCYGTGGGGGAGVLWLSNSEIPHNMRVFSSGGSNGVITNPQSPCFGSNYGATPGEDGKILFNFEIEGCCDETAFFYIDFSDSKNLQFIERSFQSQNTITLTAASPWKGGAVWHKQKVPVKKGFTTDFAFRFSDGENKYEYEEYPGADGIAFVIQNSSMEAAGSYGGDMGYAGIENSFIVEFDTYKNQETNMMQTSLNDPNANHVAVFGNQLEPAVADHSHSSSLLTIELDEKMPIKPNGDIYYCRIEYDFSTKNLTLYLDTTVNHETPLFVLPNIDLSNQLELEEGEFAWVGFTSATGIAFEKHELLNWSFCPEPTDAFITDIEEEKTLANHERILFYPNPTESELIIETTNREEVISAIQIFDIYGRNIANINLINFQSSYTINLDNLSIGNYQVIVTTSQNIYSKKVLVER